MDSENSALVVVLGPTGSGKSTLAIELARKLDGEIVNFDSVQLYADLIVGAAKTPPAERNGVAHHLLDVLSPDADLSAGAYARLARPVLTAIAARGRIPVLAGGTGFYLRALLDGLSPAPPRDRALRERLETIWRRHPAALHRMLRRSDPAAARRIHPNDRQKLIRAIELAGVAAVPPEPLAGFRILKLGLEPERNLLYSRLDQRTMHMFASGLLGETATLLSAGLPVSAKPLQALGYRQAARHLAEGLPLAEAISECQAKTRQYAKRQLTWFRPEAGVLWLRGFGNDPAIQARAIAAARAFLASTELAHN